MNYSLRNSGKYIVATMLISVLIVIPFNHGETATVEELEQRIEQLEKEQQSVSSPYVSSFGGRMQFDMTFNTDDSDSLVQTVGDGTNLSDGSEFRRLRTYVAGELTSFADYKVQADFANGDVSVLDAYMRFHDLPYIGEILAGRFNESFTFDESTSSKYITFMTRSALSDLFQTSWNNGVQWNQSWADDRYNLTVGSYFSNDDNGESPGSTNGKYNLTGRFTTPIVHHLADNQILHFGLDYSHRQPGNANAPDTDAYTTSIEPEVHQTDKFLRLRIPNVNSYEVYGAELAGVSGPFSFQAEYFEQEFDRSTGNEPKLDSYYAQASYFLTGESRPYSKSSGSFGRVIPYSNFLGMSEYEESGGPGAWEVAARFSNVDFTDAKNVTTQANNLASELDIVTVGLNWYPNSHTRWMVNYVDADQDDLGDASYVTTRFQVDF